METAAPIDAPTDTPVTRPPPQNMLERLQVVAGNLARPYAIYASATAAAISTVLVALGKADYAGGSLFIAAAWAGAATLAGVRAFENVKVAQAQATTTPAADANK